MTIEKIKYICEKKEGFEKIDICQCKACDFLAKTFHSKDMTNREYWFMTEVFVFLHDGKDWCDKAPFYWQPIETAPKDGTKILLYGTKEIGYQIGKGFFYKDHSCKEPQLALPPGWNGKSGINNIVPLYWILADVLPEPPKKETI